jgi:hypothetical protein
MVPVETNLLKAGPAAVQSAPDRAVVRQKIQLFVGRVII